MPQPSEYQIQPIGDTWVLLAGDVTLTASDVKKKTGKVRLSIDDGAHGNVFTDSVKLTEHGGRQKVVKALQPYSIGVDERMLRALEQAIFGSSNGQSAHQGGPNGQKRKALILDDAPERIDRPLSIVGDRVYAAAWVYLDTGEREMVIVRDDGALFADAELADARPLADLDKTIHLLTPLYVRHGWSGRGVNAFRKGRRPDPAAVFEQLTRVINHHVVFVRSLGEQAAMAELLATYTLHTWMLDASSVAGYLWFNGEKGSGKSWALKMCCQVGFSGQELLAGSTLASLRDLSDNGGLLGLDDAENVTDPDKFDEDKRALFLSGNRRGATYVVKEPSPTKRGWEIRHVNVFGPRVFSSIRTPDATLASRCIQVPMCRASHEMPDPMDEAQWPIPRRQLIDDLWALSVSALMQVRRRASELPQHTQMIGRTLDPWRGVLAVARWLEQDCGVVGLFGRLTQLAKSYQQEREEFEADDPVRLAIRCLGELLEDYNGPLPMVFNTSELTERMNKLGKELEAVEEGREIKASRVGRLLGKLRFKRPPNLPGKRRWSITPAFYDALALAHGVTQPMRAPVSEPPAAVEAEDSLLQPDAQEF